MYVNNQFNKSILLSLLLFPLTNIVLFVFNNGEAGLDSSWIFIIKLIAINCVVALAEELFFRGLLLREMVFGFEIRPMIASVVVSIAFGVMHLLNVNSYATWNYAILQSICAFAVSINLSAIFIKSKSLLWCVAVHGLINMTSVGLEFNNERFVLGNIEYVIFLLVSFIYLICGVEMLNDEVMEGR